MGEGQVNSQQQAGGPTEEEASQGISVVRLGASASPTLWFLHHALTSGRRGAGDALLFAVLQVRELAEFPSWGDSHRGSTGLQMARQEWPWRVQVSIPLKNKHQALEASYPEIPSTRM